MANNDSNSTIIIKKIKKGGHGHHGGAWKIAYADFVTAMMAFFLLMWLLSLSSEDQLNGLADYFAPSEGIIGESGSYFGHGSLKDALEESMNNSDALSNGEIEYDASNTGEHGAMLDGKKLETLGQTIKESIEHSEELAKHQDSIIIEQTSDGLLIQITSRNKEPKMEVFKFGKSELSQEVKDIISHIINMINFIPNYISIVGHSDSAPLGKNKNYTNWELSSDRSNAVRRFMISKGLSKSQIIRVIGKGDAEPLILENTRDIRNRRIGIVILNPNIITDKSLQNAPKHFFN